MERRIVSEDILSLSIAAIFIVVATLFKLSGGVLGEPWLTLLLPLLLAVLAFVALRFFGSALSQNIRQVLFGLVLVFALAQLGWAVTAAVNPLTLPGGIPGKALEYPLWAVLAGLGANLLTRDLKIKEQIKPGIRTELFLKIGLVLLGAGINLQLIVTAAGGAILQTLILITSVFFFSWWLGGKMGLDDRLRAVMSTALSVCGVSAAIAAAGSVSAKKEQVTYVTGLVILVALPMMVVAPLLAQAMHLPEPVAGAWFGGNIDTTAAVVGAGTLYGATAQKVASIVKSTQNALIGVVAFLLALAFAGRNPESKGRPSARIIWERFPKFVLGFVVASILFSLGWIDGAKGSLIETMMRWAFTFAFVSMGMEMSASEFRKMGWKPFTTFLIVTVFNTLLALGTAWVLFGAIK
jgi:uncharacterized membrane protein YadS